MQTLALDTIEVIATEDYVEALIGWQDLAVRTAQVHLVERFERLWAQVLRIPGITAQQLARAYALVMWHPDWHAVAKLLQPSAVSVMPAATAEETGVVC